MDISPKPSFRKSGEDIIRSKNTHLSTELLILLSVVQTQARYFLGSTTDS